MFSYLCICKNSQYFFSSFCKSNCIELILGNKVIILHPNKMSINIQGYIYYLKIILNDQEFADTLELSSRNSHTLEFKLSTIYISWEIWNSPKQTDPYINPKFLLQNGQTHHKSPKIDGKVGTIIFNIKLNLNLKITLNCTDIFLFDFEFYTILHEIM